MSTEQAELRTLEERIGYRFRDPALLQAALTHRSFRYEKPQVLVDNERLEFLGDAVLGFIVSDWLYRTVEGDEGALTETRSLLINGQTLGRVARDIDLGRYLLMGVGEMRAAGNERISTLADALEALIGAVYLDGGIRACRRVVKGLLIPARQELRAGAADHNPKGILQQWTQSHWRRQPEYTVLEMSGPSHDRRFVVRVCLPDGTTASGSGSSRRGAETLAAAEALRVVRMQESGESAPD